MKSFLDALQEGRLVELADTDKDKALEYLALLIEAIPDIGSKADLVHAIRENEAKFNSALGKGIAVPHVRIDKDGELLCAVGWSPEGIDYGASDGKKIHLIIMYYVPESQKNAYLKEISGLAKVINNPDEFGFIDAKDIHGIRNRLLNWVEIVIDKAIPDSKATMIKLEAKQSVVESTLANLDASKSVLIPFVVVLYKTKHLVLSQDPKLVDLLERERDILKLLAEKPDFSISKYRIALQSISSYFNGKIYQGVAIQIAK